MRLVNVENRLCLLEDGDLVDVESASKGRFGPDPMSPYANWREFAAWGAGRPAGSGTPTLGGVRLRSPVPRPRQSFGTGANYAAHALEADVEVPKYPVMFSKFASCIAGPDDDIAIWGDQTDWEIELVVVIAERCWRVPAAVAWEHVAGVAIGQDISDRAIQWADPRLVFTGVGKSLPGYGPTGPWLVTPDELGDLDKLDLQLTCTLNGEVVQDANTRDLIYDIPALIEYMSSAAELLPGDLIWTGTPAGVGLGRKPPRFLAPGDELSSSISGIGTMTSKIVAPS